MKESGHDQILLALNRFIRVLPQPTLYVIDLHGTVLAANIKKTGVSSNEPKENGSQTCYRSIFHRNSPCPGCRLFTAGSFGEKKKKNLEEAILISGFLVTQKPVEIPGLGEVIVETVEHHEPGAGGGLENSLITLGALVQTVAHEISNPLIGLNLSAHSLSRLLKNPEPDMEQAQKLVHLVKEDIERAGAIISDIRNYSSRPGEPARYVNLFSVVSGALEQALRTGRAKDLKTRVRWRIPKTLHVRGNRYKLEQCFINIFQNSIEAFHYASIKVSKPLIHVNVTSQKDIAGMTKNTCILIQVIDNAGGISDKDMDHLFEPYFTTKEKWKGMGLGLFVVKTILTEHDASVKLVSRRGKTFFNILFQVPDGETITS